MTDFRYFDSAEGALAHIRARVSEAGLEFHQVFSPMALEKLLLTHAYYDGDLIVQFKVDNTALTARIDEARPLDDRTLQFVFDRLMRLSNAESSDQNYFGIRKAADAVHQLRNR